ncbi:MAG: SDR family NAD(P)-dependent oxidoreductase [Syntrophobacteraceae bacterium]
MDMTGRCVVVTGASSGLGRETAILLSQLGCRIILVARNRGRLEEAAQMLDGQGHAIEPFDLSNADDIPQWIKDLAGKYGRFDGVVHFAGIVLTQPIRDWNAEDCDRLMSINLYPCFALAKGFRQKAVHAKEGGLVFITSIAGLVGEIARSIYSASKSGIIGLTRSLAWELARDGIRVNAIAPGFVHTPMTDADIDRMPPDYLSNVMAGHPLGLGKPRDVAHAVAFLLAETGRWITGTILVVDGGYTAQ